MMRNSWKPIGLRQMSTKQPERNASIQVVAFLVGIAVTTVWSSSADALGSLTSTGEYRIGSNTYFANTASGLVIGNVKDGWRIGIQRLSPSGEYGYGRIYGGNGFTKCGWVRADAIAYKIGPRDQSQDCPPMVGDVGNAFNSYSGSGITDGIPTTAINGCPAYENISGAGQGSGLHPTTISSDVRYRYTTNDDQWALVRDASKPQGNNWVFTHVSCVNRPASTYPEFYVDLVIQSHYNGLLVAAENGGDSYLIANRTAIGPWERFRLGQGQQFSNGHQIQLQVYNGRWVAAENGGGSEINANRPQPSVWETFTVIKLNSNGSSAVGGGDLFALRSVDGVHYWVAEHAGNAPLNATRTAIGPWETFRALFAANPYP